jgi:hypothetical protein
MGDCLCFRGTNCSRHRRSGGTGFPDTDGLGGPFIPVTDGPGGPMVRGTISSMTGRRRTTRTRMGKHCKSYTNIWRTLKCHITLILRCESKFPDIKSLVSTHSACPCKNYIPKCSQIPHELMCNLIP